ncbi:hypothetical protein BCR37DRAFT_394281 [Protomyces lactucae-debilis]|uniref:Uncharacterized protein n=1 Tax=Protomyces lactucae-debilis TaxID=2754530 RepID=A0A1Y2F6M5_PROLT|nr:uncharacterized protein BCR37DRAFT_394281 [Protomyces lactucae-debilis]ORY79560.1 hypothetical protein BCR37DRAFT_394281 [Protomyces lactucae-debilis]
MAARRVLKDYIPGKIGYAPGFLPQRSSAVRQPKPLPLPEKTSPAPKKEFKSNAAYAVWKREMAEKRRGYMVAHLEHTQAQIPIKAAQDRAKMLEGRAKREEALTKPISEAERLSLPSIEATLAQEYPILDTGKEERAARRRSNRQVKAQMETEDRLADLIDIHHAAEGYACTMQQLDTMLDTCFTTTSVAPMPKHTMATLKNNLLLSSTRAQMEEQLLGTAAGGKPGIAEVLPLLHKQSQP